MTLPFYNWQAGAFAVSEPGRRGRIQEHVQQFEAFAFRLDLLTRRWQKRVHAELQLLPRHSKGMKRITMKILDLGVSS